MVPTMDKAETLLFPATSRGWSSPDENDQFALLSGVASAAPLLYFDKVHLGWLGWPGDRGLPSIKDLEKQLQLISSRHGGRDFTGIFASPDVTWDEQVAIMYALDVGDKLGFMRAYAPLIDSGILTVHRMINSIPATLKNWVAFRDGETDQLQDSLAVAFGGYDNDDMPEWFRRNPHEFGQIISTYNGIWSAAMLLRTTLGGADLARTKDPEWKKILTHYSLVMAMRYHNFFAAIQELPVTYTNPAFCELHSHISNAARGSHQAGRTALTVLDETFVQIPTILPRTPESVLYLREKLATELNEFRIALVRAGEDLSPSNDLPSPDKISSYVREKFRRPLENIELAASKQGREFLKNIVSSSGFINGAVTFGAALLAGCSGLASTLAGIAVPVASEGLKTIFGTSKQTAQTLGLTFIYRASKK
jgi:hypothetical protein